MTLYNYDRRRFVAMEHPSEEALKKYLQEHPKADPKNHKVNEGSKGDGATSKEDEKTKKVVGDAMRGAGANQLLHGMGLSGKDARAVIKSYFQNKPPKNPKHQKAYEYLTKPGSGSERSGRERMGMIMDAVRQALKKSGQAHDRKDVEKAVDSWIANPPKPTYK